MYRINYRLRVSSKMTEVTVDLKKNVNAKIDIDINMLYLSDAATFTFGTNSRIPVIAQIDYDDNDIARVVLLVDNQPAGGSFFTAELSHFEGTFSTGRWTALTQDFRVPMFIRWWP